VTHVYPLYVDVLAQCFCCRTLAPFHFTSPSDQAVCTACLNHLGTEKAGQRDTDHTTLWAVQFKKQQELHRAFSDESAATLAARSLEVDALTKTAAELTALVAGTFEQSTRTAPGESRALLETELVKRSERKTELLNRRYDSAMAVLWQLAALHHAAGSGAGTCQCGKPLPRCPEATALEPVRPALQEWEQKNIALADAGNRHGLPAGHPRLVAASAPRVVTRPGRTRP
jgi:hypothetical protein